MGNLCCYFCETKRCAHCGVPYEYYSTDEQRSRPSCRVDYFNDYPGLNNGYHKFN